MIRDVMMSIIDLHTDFILAEAGLGKKIFDIDTSSQISKAKAETVNVKTVLSGFSYDDEKNCTETMLSEMERFVKNKKSEFKLIFHIEGANILSNNISSLEKFYLRGVRSIGLAHVHDNDLVGSSSGERKYGLTTRGVALIRKALKLGMLIDLAHMSQRGFAQTLKLIGKKPPLVSHAACFSINKNPRNIKDSQIKAVAKRNGVIGIFFSGKYIKDKGKVSVKNVVDHIDHIVKLVGVDHVAIGSDFGGITKGTPVGLESVDKLPKLFSELARRKYSTEMIEKIAYKNAQRILTAWLKESL